MSSRRRSAFAHVADGPDVDARSIPGGYLVFHRGLLDFAESEAALRRARELSPDDPAVLTALTSVHDALRVHLVERAGTWDQHIAEPADLCRAD